jgi:hypothetical protein
MTLGDAGLGTRVETKLAWSAQAVATLPDSAGVRPTLAMVLVSN